MQESCGHPITGIQLKKSSSWVPVIGHPCDCTLVTLVIDVQRTNHNWEFCFRHDCNYNNNNNTITKTLCSRLEEYLSSFGFRVIWYTTLLERSLGKQFFFLFSKESQYFPWQTSRIKRKQFKTHCFPRDHSMQVGKVAKSKVIWQGEMWWRGARKVTLPWSL